MEETTTNGKLTLALLALLAGTASGAERIAFTPAAAEVEAFDFLEVTVEARDPPPGNPFTEAVVEGRFQLEGGEPVRVEGFCDSDDGAIHRIRFLPRKPGSYSYSVEYRRGEVRESASGTFRARDGKRRGMVRVDPDHPWHFLWEGTGEHYFWNSTTTYWLLGWDDQTIRTSLDRLHSLKVNRIRVALNARVKDGRDWHENVFPTGKFAFRLNPWPARRPESFKDPGFDVTRFDLSHWRKVERLLRHARERDLNVSLIFYLDGNKPGMDPFGRSGQGGEDELRYYRYAAARLSAYSNVMWDLSNEYRFLRDDAWAEKMGAYLKDRDPYRHLISIHGYEDFRFRKSPWADFAMYQSWDEGGGYRFMLRNRRSQAEAGRPIPQVNEEYGYEDHYPVGWGGDRKAPARSADNRRRLAWEISMAGCYQTTGERADSGTGWGPDTGGGWINGRGDDTMVMLRGYGRLVDFFTGFDWWRAEPRGELVEGSALCLADPGSLYALYLPAGGSATVKLEPGTYRARWFNPRNGETVALGEARGPSWTSPAAPDREDWALLLTSAASPAAGGAPATGTKPLALHPENPHYFLFRGKPAVLITSTEHYGAVLNLDFDALPYLDELRASGFNLTRTFSGTYREVPGSFNIEGNTLAPLPGRYISPWARSETPGYFDGGNKFDLSRWDEAYFRRLKEFIARAGERGIVVELVLFCPNYEEVLWKASPLNSLNNVNGVGQVPRDQVYTLKHPDLLSVQDALVKKMAAELAEFDNLYYEIANEPYFGGITLEWQAHIARTLSEAEAALGTKHLLAQNIANGSAKIENPDPRVSIFNFHYAAPPVTVPMNYGLGKVIAFDESGFRGPEDKPYRTEAWDFLFAGGAVYDNLDYSFTPDHEDGTARPRAPGGGGRPLRKQLSILKEFLEGFEFVRMAPRQVAVRGGVPPGLTVQAFAEEGRAYAVYVHDKAEKPGEQQVDLLLDLPAGSYRAEWVNTLSGEVEKTGELRHPGGPGTFSSPKFTVDIALRVKPAGRTAGYIRDLPPERAADREARHRRVAERRAGPLVMVHRGASAFAPENTLEAYSAAMEHGADGCEVDLRRTRDGVLVLFHDDMLDRLTDGFGTVSQLTYHELLSLKPRAVYGTAGASTRPPTFAALLELARERAMLLHLDVKEPGLEDEIADLVEAADVWDHLVSVNASNAPRLSRDPRLKPLAYKGPGLFEGRQDMDPEAVRAILARPGQMVMVDDPRVAARALERRPSPPLPLPAGLRMEWPECLSSEPSGAGPLVPQRYLRSLAGKDSAEDLVAILAREDPERMEPQEAEERERRRTERILERAWAAQRLGEIGRKSARLVELLELHVKNRSLHREWIHHGLDGAMAARALGRLGAVESAPVLVEAFRRIDPALKRVADPAYSSYPLSWTDFRAKMTIIPALGDLPCPAAKGFLLEYVGLVEERAREMGPLLHEEAARALFRQDLTRAEVEGLLRSSNPAVRGAAVLECLDHPTPERAAALDAAAPWARELR